MKYVFLDPDGQENIGMQILVPGTTGIIYQNQCGGYSCERKQREGFIVPIGQNEKEQILAEFFERHFKGHGYSPSIQWNNELINELAVIINGIVCWGFDSEYDSSRINLVLDKNRIDECIEAWIPIKIGEVYAYLLTKNSD